MEGRRFPYTLDKTVSFVADDTLRIDYAVTNLSLMDAPDIRFFRAASRFRRVSGQHKKGIVLRADKAGLRRSLLYDQRKVTDERIALKE